MHPESISVIVWKGGIEPQTRLWLTRLKDYNTTSPKTETRNTRHMAYNAFSMKLKNMLIKYLHQVTFCPPKETLLKSISNKTFLHGLDSQHVQYKNISQTQHQRQTRAALKDKNKEFEVPKRK